MSIRKSKKYINLTCPACNESFEIYERFYIRNQLRNATSFCSKECRDTSNITSVQLICEYCNKLFSKKQSECKSTKHHFCSRSCSASYHNRHKDYGMLISKMETYIRDKITIDFPDLEIIYNGKGIIGSELDIFIPSINLAIELNGPVHYEPIFGKDKLTQIQNNDKSKLCACDEKQIDLIIVANLKTFSKKFGEEVYSQIKNILSSRVVAREGIEPSRSKTKSL